jgi:phosphonate transport system substrate-binding protein
LQAGQSISTNVESKTMKQRSLLRWLAVISGVFLATTVYAQNTYTFGVVPQFEPRKLSAIWTPILQELERRTGLQFQMVGAARIPEFEGEYEVGKYDFAYMNPYHALIAKGTQSYEPIVRDGSEKLFGIVVAAKDGPYTSLRELNGKSIAFPSPNSLGASLLVRSDLDKQHIKFLPVWAQTHTSAYLNVVLGKVEAAGGVMGTLKQQPQAVQDKLRVIYETRRISPHPIVAHPRVPAADREKVRKALLEMGATTEGAALLAKIPMPQVVNASFDDYKEIKGWGLEKYYVKGSE